MHVLASDSAVSRLHVAAFASRSATIGMARMQTETFPGFRGTVVAQLVDHGYSTACAPDTATPDMLNSSESVTNPYAMRKLGLP